MINRQKEKVQEAEQVRPAAAGRLSNNQIRAPAIGSEGPSDTQRLGDRPEPHEPDPGRHRGPEVHSLQFQQQNRPLPQVPQKRLARAGRPVRRGPVQSVPVRGAHEEKAAEKKIDIRCHLKACNLL